METLEFKVPAFIFAWVVYSLSALHGLTCIECKRSHFVLIRRCVLDSVVISAKTAIVFCFFETLIWSIMQLNFLITSTVPGCAVR